MLPLSFRWYHRRNNLLRIDDIDNNVTVAEEVVYNRRQADAGVVVV